MSEYRCEHKNVRASNAALENLINDRAESLNAVCNDCDKAIVLNGITIQGLREFVATDQQLIEMLDIPLRCEE